MRTVLNRAYPRHDPPPVRLITCARGARQRAAQSFPPLLQFRGNVLVIHVSRIIGNGDSSLKCTSSYVSLLQRMLTQTDLAVERRAPPAG